MAVRQAKIMMAQFKAAVKEPHEFLKFALKSDNETGVWYILLSGFPGDDGEFEGGEYICRMEAPDDFPFNPPHFYMLTENGVYGVEKKVCVSIGEYHKDQYRPALGMAGFASQLVSGMVGWRDLGSGIEIHKTSVEVKKRHAAESRAKNWKNYPEIMRRITESYAGYSKTWDLTKVPECLRTKLGLTPAPTPNIVTPDLSKAVSDLTINN